jgi:CubicO group peptidase (beta-lactamase class C family)
MTVAAKALVASIVIGVVAGCTGVGASVPPASVAPSGTSLPAPSPSARATPSPTAAPSFPTAAFAGMRLDPLSGDRATTYQAILKDIAGDRGTTATVIAAEGTWTGAVGKADGVHDVQAESQFGIASITKSVVAAQVMQLVEAGELALDAPATDYLPEGFAFDTNGATIRQLLDMRSGIPDWFDDAMKQRVEADRLRVWKTDEVLALLGPERNPPGTTFEYADTNYNLLGLVIEHVRGRPLVEVLRSGVLRVEGTERLVYQPDEAPTDPIAMPLGEPRTALKKGGGYLPSISDASSAGPAGSLASDSISLARWWRAFCAGEIVSQASLNEMSTLVGGRDGYGLGLFNPVSDWGLQGIGHEGGNFGYSSWAGCLLGDHPVVLVVLANGSIDDLGGMPKPLFMAALSN